MTAIVAALFAFAMLVGWFVVLLFRLLAVFAFPQQQRPAALGPPLGALAPAFSYLKLMPDASEHGDFRPGDGRRLLVFADPGCSSCEEALHDLFGHVQRDALDNAIVVTTASATIVRAVAVFSESPIAVVRVGARVRSAYNAFAAPLFIFLAEDGTVTSIERSLGEDIGTRLGADWAE